MDTVRPKKSGGRVISRPFVQNKLETEMNNGKIYRSENKDVVGEIDWNLQDWVITWGRTKLTV